MYLCDFLCASLDQYNIPDLREQKSSPISTSRGLGVNLICKKLANV